MSYQTVTTDYTNLLHGFICRNPGNPWRFLLEAGLESRDVDLMFLDELPESAAVFLCDLCGPRDVAFARGQQTLNIVALKARNLFRFRFLQ